MIDVYADKLLTDRLDQQRRDDGRVNSSGQREQYLLVSDLFPQGFELFLNKSFCKFWCGDSFH